LQLSQNASVDDVPADERDDLAKSQEEAAKPRVPERKDAR
jgi:hypothetical protein